MYQFRFLNWAAIYGDRDVRLCVAINPSIPMSLLEKLATDSYKDVSP